MADYDKAYGLTTKIEGGHVNVSTDYGRETYRGISRRWFPAWEGWPFIDQAKEDHHTELDKFLADNLPLQAMIHKFYKSEFWDKFSGDRIPSQAVANELFGAAVNKGAQTVAEWFQRCLNVLNKGRYYPNLRVDGDIGNKTMIAVEIYAHHQTDAPLLKALNILQGYHFLAECERDSAQKANIYGWLNKQITI